MNRQNGQFILESNNWRKVQGLGIPDFIQICAGLQTLLLCKEKTKRRLNDKESR
jgi:hypothetical protein